MAGREDAEGAEQQPARPRAAAGQGSKKRPVCAAAGCCFSTAVAGAGCQVHQAGQKCMWCDSTKLQAALATAAGRGRIQGSLNAFERLSSAALPLAVAKLPATFHRSSQFCTAPGCVFSQARPGEPAQTQGALHCTWCARDAGGQLAAESTAAGCVALQTALNCFSRKATDVLQVAWRRLSTEFTGGCETFEVWEREKVAAKRRPREQRRMLAADPLLQRERAGMWAEDFQRLKEEPPAPRSLNAGDVLRADGPHWVLCKPAWRCFHQFFLDTPTHQEKFCPLKAGLMCGSHEWKCEMNSRQTPSPPVCRICAHGFAESDRQPAYYDISRAGQQFAASASECLAAFHANFDAWLAAQPPAKQESCEKLRWLSVPRAVQETAQREAAAAKRAAAAAKRQATEANRDAKRQKQGQLTAKEEDDLLGSLEKPGSLTLRDLALAPVLGKQSKTEAQSLWKCLVESQEKTQQNETAASSGK
eukprot:s3697_g10.t1